MYRGPMAWYFDTKMLEFTDILLIVVVGSCWVCVQGRQYNGYHFDPF